MNKPDPVMDPYGYMVDALWDIFWLSEIGSEIEELARDALSAAGEDT